MERLRLEGGGEGGARQLQAMLEDEKARREQETVRANRAERQRDAVAERAEEERWAMTYSRSPGSQRRIIINILHKIHDQFVIGTFPCVVNMGVGTNTSGHIHFPRKHTPDVCDDGCD